MELDDKVHTSFVLDRSAMNMVTMPNSEGLMWFSWPKSGHILGMRLTQHLEIVEHESQSFPGDLWSATANIPVKRVS